MQKLLLFGLSIIAVTKSPVFGQTNTYAQFWNEYCITGAIFKKSGLELNIGQAWTGTPSHKSMFAENSQIYVRGWMHYYFNARWKFSGFLAYYSNKDIPEINQEQAPEIRVAVQAIYFFKKIPYTLNARVRLENRNIRNDNGKYETNFRMRYQLRCIYPLNSKVIHQGTVYAYGAEEIMFKTSSGIAGSQLFDRNRFTIGGGYSITDDIQTEITYVNEFLPRPEVNKLYNALQLNMYFNNPFINLKNTFFKKRAPAAEAERD